MSLLRLYGKVALIASRRALGAWPLALCLVLYAVILEVATRLVTPLGILGGFVLSFVAAACLSSYLHLLATAVGGRRIRWTDVKESFGARFWDAISVMFAFWVIDLLVKTVATGAGDRAQIIIALANLAMAVFFNPALELLYQSNARSFGLLAEAARFVSRQGLEWLLPNIVFAVATLALTGLLHGPPGQIVLWIAGLLLPVAAGGDGLWALFGSASLPVAVALLVFIHWVMIFRGLLFAALTTRSPRAAAWPVRR